MKKYLFFTVLFVQILCVNAQEKKSANDYKFAIKAYSNISTLYNSNGQKGYAMNVPTFALQWKTGKNWQEVELLNLTSTSYMNTTILPAEETRISSTNFSAKYEYNWNFLKNPHRLTPSVGFGAVLSTNFYSSRGTTMDKSKYNNSSLGLTPFITPRLVYNLTPRLLTEISMPIQVIRPVMYVERINTTSVNSIKTNMSTVGREFMPRIGVGYRF